MQAVPVGAGTRMNDIGNVSLQHKESMSKGSWMPMGEPQ